MANANSTTAPSSVVYRGPVPGHVRELMQIAAREGLKARLEVDLDEESGERDEGTMIIRISGSEAALRRTGIVRSNFQFPTRRWRQHGGGTFVFAVVRDASGAFELSMSYPAPTAIAKATNFEKMSFQGSTMHALWGSERDVEQAAGLHAGKLARGPAGQRSKKGGAGTRQWSVTWFPSGNVLFREWDETPKPQSDPPPEPSEYDTPAIFAKHAEHFFKVFSGCIINIISGTQERHDRGECTIRYDADTIAQVKDAFAEARLAIQAATPIRTKKAKAVLAAREDTEFRAFLTQLVPPSDRAGGGSQ